MEEELEIVLENEEELLEIILKDEEELLDVTLENDVIEVPVYDHEIYKGEHDITPLAFQEQELETKDKLLEKNIKVKEIPFFETSNLYGDTVYIGGN